MADNKSGDIEIFLAELNGAICTQADASLERPKSYSWIAPLHIPFIHNLVHRCFKKSGRQCLCGTRAKSAT